ncbi:MAG: cation diffusion facilitator family transporter [Gemmobacter sp.]|nr:cation diffusion facilitator family transporter [Gemmobacter sp.]
MERARTTEDLNRLNLSAARASVAVALTLVGLKLWATLSTGALSVLASLADSGMDLLISLGAMLALRYAARPPDDDHAFGHTSVEDLAALAQSVILTGAAVVIAWAAVTRLMVGQVGVLASEGTGMVVMAVAVVLTLSLMGWQSHVIRRTGSRVVAADRLHYTADLLPALGSVVALYVSSRWGFWQADALVGLVAAAVLGWGALQIGRGAWDALMDRHADPVIIAGIARLADTWPGVRGWHDLKTRTAGSRVFVHLHIELDGGQTLTEAHEIGAALRRAILDRYPQADVIIHKDVARRPADN